MAVPFRHSCCYHHGYAAPALPPTPQTYSFSKLFDQYPSTMVHHQADIVANACAGPPIINGPLHQPSTNGIIMNVIHFLHEESFTEDWKDILLSLPERIAVVSIAHFVLKFCQGSAVVSLL